MRFLLFLFSFIVQIQIGITQTNIQSSVKSKYYLDTYVGYSNANYKIDKSLPDNATHINKDLAIPLGFKAEILICENFGIGVDAFFNKGKVGYIENEYEYSFERNLMQFLATANLLGTFIGLFISVPLYFFRGVNGIVPAIILSSAASFLVALYFSNKLKIAKVAVSKIETIEEGKEMLKMGYLAGSNVYVCTQHTPKIVADFFEVLDPIFALVQECEDGRDVISLLNGPVCHSGFKRLN